MCKLANLGECKPGSLPKHKAHAPCPPPGKHLVIFLTGSPFFPFRNAH